MILNKLRRTSMMPLRQILELKRDLILFYNRENLSLRMESSLSQKNQRL
jgi:hypothetical protein